MMFEPKRLHPVAAVINTIRQIKGIIVPFAAFLFLGTRAGWDVFYYVAAGVGILIAFVTGILSWLRFTYSVEGNELRLEYGVLIRKKRYIPLERIQSVDRTEGILQRPFGLVQIKIETAGGGAATEDPEAVLSAITKRDASLLEEAIAAGNGKQARDQAVNELRRNNRPIYSMPISRLFLMATTSGGAGVVISAVLAFIFQFEEIIPYKKVFKGFENLVSNGVVFISILIFITLLAAWLLAIAGMMVKYGNYTVEKTEEELVISRGLLEKRRITIPLKRIQAVQISQNPVRELLGYAAVHVDSAGGAALDKDSARIMLLPLVKLEEIEAVLGGHLRNYHFNAHFTPVPRRSLWRYMFRSLIFTLPPAAFTAWFFQPWGNLAVLVPAAAALWAYARFKAAGWEIKREQLSFRKRMLGKTIILMQKNKIQSIDIRESYFQRKKQLARIDAYIKSGTGISGGGVQDAESADAIAIYNWLSSSAKECS
ncbi:PH domain-containing protein [Neobacillus sp. SCS-31]|uniref:PH domain-containing protein n=1 Tax=Neobacillus oceani TaxID=3115292 RepID=UPI0039059748